MVKEIKEKFGCFSQKIKNNFSPKQLVKKKLGHNKPRRCFIKQEDYV